MGSPEPDPSQLAPVPHDVVQVAVFPERIKRRPHFEEDLSMRRLGAARLQIVDQSLTHFVDQRQSQWLARFRLGGDFNGRILPMKLIQSQCVNISGTQS